MRLAHVSDLHFGRIRDGRILNALRDDIARLRCDAVVITGDLTQRARPWQFKAAAEWMGTLHAPLLVIPGNHDVHAWWHRADLRLIDPLRRYKRLITSDLMPHIELPGLSVLGINSAYGRTIQGGYCAPSVAAKVGAYFAEQPEDAVKVLAVHHPLMPWQGLEAARGGHRLFDSARAAGVDVICCGHGHVSHVIATGEESLLVSLAGTASSNRWREPEMGVNSWHCIEGSSSDIQIHVRRYEADQGYFDEIPE